MSADACLQHPRRSQRATPSRAAPRRSQRATSAERDVVARSLADPADVRTALDEALPPGLDVLEVVVAGPGSLADRLVYAAAIVGPVMSLPQLYDIWVLRRTGVSIVTWSAYLLMAMLWLLYGLERGDRTVVLAQILWLVVDLGVVGGLLAARC